MRNNLLTAIYAHICKNTEHPFVQTLIGTGGEAGSIRFFSGEGRQGDTYPSAVCSLVSDVSSGVFEDAPREVEWQVNCFSNNYTQIHDLSDWCRNLFDGKEIGSDDCRYLCLHNMSTGGMRTEDSEPWQVTVTFFTLI